MKCPDCGASIKDNGAFCSYCGAKLPVEEKKDEKKREFRFHFNDSEASVRRAEIRKEREAQKLRAQAEEAKRQEEERKRLMEEQAREQAFFNRAWRNPRRCSDYVPANEMSPRALIFLLSAL